MVSNIASSTNSNYPEFPMDKELGDFLGFSLNKCSLMVEKT